MDDLITIVIDFYTPIAVFQDVNYENCIPLFVNPEELGLDPTCRVEDNLLIVTLGVFNHINS